MDEKERQEFLLEDILKEFSDGNAQPDEDLEKEVLTALFGEEENSTQEPEETPVAEEEPVSAAEKTKPQMTDDTIRLDTTKFTHGQVRIAQPLEEEAEEQPQQEAFASDWEPEFEQPIAEYVPPQPIIFHPRSRLRELKKKLVAGPERRYYELSEKGLGKLQAAIFLSVLVVLISAGATVMYALGMVQENRLRLMVFGQFLAMLISALLGSFQLLEGAADLFRKRFTLNTLLVFTFISCCVDGVMCLQQLRVPCCAAFSLEMTMSLWSAYQRRNTEMGQMDTMRKATHLDSVGVAADYYEGRKGLLRGEGQVEDFMDTYDVPSKPEKILGWYALGALIASIGIGVAAGVMHDVYTGIQVTAVSLLAAMPATAFITLTRPFAVLERRLHALGTVLCGWQGVEGLSGKAVFPLDHEDLFPAGAAKMNGVKFYGDRDPDEIVAYGTALVAANGGGLAPLFSQLLDSRNGRHYDAENLHSYENGGIGGEVCDEPVLVGGLSFLREMGVEIPESIRVNNAVCIAVDGELCGLVAVTYEKVRSSSAGLSTLCAYRGLKPVLISDDFQLTESFVRSKFGMPARKMLFPDEKTRKELRQKELEVGTQAMALITSEGLAPFAYSVTGARALRSACNLGMIVHMAGGILGMGMMLVLAILGAVELLTPANMFLYQLVWMIPGLLITEWTRTI